MEATLDAFATGEDGKNGVRGRIVSKQGSMIAQSLMGGFIQGVANIYQPARIPQLTLNSGGSSYGRPNPSMAVQEGIAGGIQSAGKAVADFYIDMARNTFPIIEVDAGRKVTFVVSRSVSVSAKSDSDIGSTVRDGAAALGGAVNRVTGG
jgi:conjugal transfer pilus assembly protein TraB